jgi:cell shape-determining protein MreD
MIRRISGIILGVLAFFAVYGLTGLGTPSQPNWALAALIGLVVALLWPWLFGIVMVRRHRSKQDEEIQAEVQRQLAEEKAKANQG